MLLYSGGHLQISTPVASCGVWVGVKTAASMEASSRLKRNAATRLERETRIFYGERAGNGKLTHVAFVNSALSEAFTRMYCKFCNATIKTSLVTL